MLPDLERLIELQEIESKAAVATKAIADAPGRIAALDALLHDATAALDTAKHSLAESKTRRSYVDKDLDRRAAAPEQVQRPADAGQDQRTSSARCSTRSKAAADEVGAARGARPRQHDGGRRDQRRHQEGRSRAQGGAGEGDGRARRHRAGRQAAAGRARRVDRRARQAGAAMDNKGVVETFERIAKVRGTAVARAEGERCTVCQVRLRPAVFVHVLKNDQIVQCDSCQRILYFVRSLRRRPPRRPPPRPASDHRVFRRRRPEQSRPGRIWRLHH